MQNQIAAVETHPLFLKLSTICPSNQTEWILGEWAFRVTKESSTIRKRVREGNDIKEQCESIPYFILEVIPRKFGPNEDEDITSSFTVYHTGVEGMRIAKNFLWRLPYPKNFEPPKMNTASLARLAKERASVLLRILERVYVK